MKTTVFCLFLSLFITLPQVLADDANIDGNVERMSSYSSSQVKSWCGDRVRVLRRAYDEALVHYEVLNYQAAEVTLTEGLHQAAEDIDPYYMGALTSRALQRGVYLLSQVKDGLKGDKRKTKTTVHFLFEYYDFVMDVADKLDAHYYSFEPTSRRRYHRVRESRHLDFERKYIKYSKLQVDLILRKMTTKGRSHGRRMVYPLGSAKGFLVLLELTSDYLANDLEESLFAEQYACEIDELFYLADKLNRYNHDEVGYPNPVFAVNQSYVDAADIVGQGCPGGSGWYTEEYHGKEKHRTKTIRKRDFIVHNHKRTLYLEEKAGYIEKLIIFAEGVRYDAMMQVTINGRPAKGPHKDIKGTIYVPGKDPKYYVTIGEHVNTIEFHPEHGKTRVLKVRAIYDHRWW